MRVCALRAVTLTLAAAIRAATGSSATRRPRAITEGQPTLAQSCDLGAHREIPPLRGLRRERPIQGSGTGIEVAAVGTLCGKEWQEWTAAGNDYEQHSIIRQGYE